VYFYVVRTTTLCILLALVAYFNLKCKQINIITAYLNAYLLYNNIVLLYLLLGYKGKGNVICLKRGIYSLR
jgi:hypothetical protein